MKKLGIIIMAIGASIILGALVLTNSHGFNPMDSNNGLNASALEFFGGLLIAGVGIVIFANAQQAARSSK
nr:hypothetical protein [Pseudopedobacter sp.]